MTRYYTNRSLPVVVGKNFEHIDAEAVIGIEDDDIVITIKASGYDALRLDEFLGNNAPLALSFYSIPPFPEPKSPDIKDIHHQGAAVEFHKRVAISAEKLSRYIDDEIVRGWAKELARVSRREEAKHKKAADEIVFALQNRNKVSSVTVADEDSTQEVASE